VKLGSRAGASDSERPAMFRPTPSRGALGAAAVLWLALAGPAPALEKVVFATNWVAQAEHGGFYQALVDGSYQACGLEVEIKVGGPRVNNRALLPVGRVDFLMGGNMLLPYAAVEQGIPTIVVAAMFQKDPQIIMTHPGQGLDTWESLKTIDLLIGDAGFSNFYQWMIAEHGFRAEQRKPYDFNSARFVADSRLGQQGYVTSEPLAVEREGGFAPNIFLLADHGFDSYSTTIETNFDMIESRPQSVRCFVEASIVGWVNYLYGDSRAANDRIKADNPEMSDAQIAFSTAKMKEHGIVDSGDAETLGIGAMSAERHARFFEQMVKAGVVSGAIDHTRAYTLDFVNQGVGLDLKASLTGN
jgi:NitT/TauT family transport system substrate-binding protein